MFLDGKHGYDSADSTPFIDNDKVVGKWHAERKLHLLEIFDAGHEILKYTPEAAYKMMQFLLGKIPSLWSMLFGTSERA